MSLLWIWLISLMSIIWSISLIINCVSRKSGETRTKTTTPKAPAAVAATEHGEGSRRTTVNELTGGTTMTTTQASKDMSIEARTPVKTPLKAARTIKLEGARPTHAKRKGGDDEQPSAGREASAKEEKPNVEHTVTFSWNSKKASKHPRKDNTSSLDEFDRPTPLLEMTATDVGLSSTQVASRSTKDQQQLKKTTTTTTTTRTKESKIPCSNNTTTTQTVHHSLSTKTPPDPQKPVRKTKSNSKSSGVKRKTTKASPNHDRAASSMVTTARPPIIDTAEPTQSMLSDNTSGASNRSKEDGHK